MAIKPILFSPNTEMVRAILNGRKTVMRLPIKPQPPANTHLQYTAGRFLWAFWEDGDKHWTEAPYQPGDILYVRETWDTEPVAPDGCFQPGGVWYYKADGDLRPEAWRGNWRPPIHMPREAARIFLRVTRARVERLQDITEEQVRAEGVEPAFEYNTLEGPVIYLDEDGK